MQLRDFIFGRFSKTICDIINLKTSYQLKKISVIERGAHQEILLRKRRHSHDHASFFILWAERSDGRRFNVSLGQDEIYQGSCSCKREKRLLRICSNGELK